MTIVSPNAALLELFSSSLRSAAPDATGREPRSEIRAVHRAGGEYVSLVATSEWFHHEHDRWPHTVDPQSIADIAAATATAVCKLAEVQ
jgi:hypothetical protein